MEPQFDDDLRQLKNALRQETFRFILIGRNRYSIYKDISNWLRTMFSERPFLELRLEGKDYRQINDELVAFKKGIVLIPNFGYLFQEKNESICVAFNQRRDAFARLDIALICFIEPGEFIELPKKVPDWWSLRSLELDFHREKSDIDITDELSNAEPESSIGGQTGEQKQVEIQRLLRQAEVTDSTNKLLLQSLYSQIGTLWFDLSSFEEAKKYFEYSLSLSQQIGDRSGESKILNNISQIYKNQGNYLKALEYLEKALPLSQQVGDQQSEGAILNTIGTIYSTKGDIKNALSYLEQSLVIRKQIGDQAGGSATLNNISLIYFNQRDDDKALYYAEQSLKINQQIGDRRGESYNLDSIGHFFFYKGDYSKALEYYERSLTIRQQIGYKTGEGLMLNNIGEVYYAQGDDKKALEYFIASRNIGQQIGDVYCIAIAKTNIGVLYFEQYQDVETAILFLIQAFNVLQRIGSPNVSKPNHYLTIIFDQVGKERFNQIVESIQNNPESELI